MIRPILFLMILAVLFLSATPALADERVPEAPALALAEEPTLEAPRPRWQQLFPPVSPSPRVSHAMAYDTTRGMAVVFGGVDETGLLNDTWEWESATMTWTQRMPAHTPSPRYGAALVYDEARGTTLLFGGTTASFFFNDTWEWDGTDWTQVFPATSPPGRWAHSMVYDSQRQVILLFGGLGGSGYLGDSWEWDGTNWTEPPISNPFPRCCAGMAYDQNRNVTVLFGGSPDYEDTWERIGSGDWQRVFPPRSPTTRERPGMVYFPRLKRVVLFGGEEGTYFDDTFLWDGAKWRTRTFDPRPPGRCCMGMVYDSVLRGVLLFGGSISFMDANDTWLFR